MASSLFTETDPDRRFGRERIALPRLVAVAGWALLSLLTFIVMLRWLSGAFAGRISSFGFGVCLLLVGLVCCGLKVAAEWPPHRLDRRSSLIFGGLITLPLVVLTISLLATNWTYGGLLATVGWAALVAWFCMSSAAVDYLRRGGFEVIAPEIERFLFPQQPSISPSANSSACNVESLRIMPMSERAEISLHATADEAEGQVVSDLQRRSSAEGGDVLEGQLHATFAEGTRQTVLHVPFVPPFAVAPRVDCEIIDGEDVRVKVGAVFPYGVRLEFKRTSQELPELSVGVEIFAEVA